MVQLSSAFHRYETVHERKFEWQCPALAAPPPLLPVAIGYSRWRAGGVQVRRNHPVFSLEVPLNGTLVHYSQGSHLRCRPGDVLLKQVGSDYRLRPDAATCAKLHVALTGSVLPLLLDCWGLRDQRALRFATVALPRAAVARLVHAVAAGATVAELGSASYHLLAVLAEGRPRRRRPALLAAAQAHIQRHYSEALSVAGIAAAVGATPTQLHRLFRRHLDSSPIAELLELRLQRAAELLRADRELLIKQVAHRCGFKDQRYFARLFKARHGMTPLDWRRQ